MPKMVRPSVGAAPSRHPSELDTGFAPVDEFGMPYLIHPYDAPSDACATWSDDDHSFYQRNAPDLSNNAGQSLRASRVQTVSRWLHNNKHRAFPRGIEHLPKTDEDKFALTVLSCAGYVSRLALDMRDWRKPRLTPMSSNTLAYVQGRRQLHVETRVDKVLGYRTAEYSQKKIGIFFAGYIKSHGLDNVIDDRVIDQFIYTASEDRRRRLGNKILGHAMNAALEPVSPMYKEALKVGYVRAQKEHPVNVVLEIFPTSVWPDYHDELERVLAS